MTKQIPPFGGHFQPTPCSFAVIELATPDGKKIPTLVVESANGVFAFSVAGVTKQLAELLQTVPDEKASGLVTPAAPGLLVPGMPGSHKG
jgi:hypothetical protein